jgi:hypothetical protein
MQESQGRGLGNPASRCVIFFTFYTNPYISTLFLTCPPSISPPNHAGYRTEKENKRYRHTDFHWNYVHSKHEQPAVSITCQPNAWRRKIYSVCIRLFEIRRTSAFLTVNTVLCRNTAYSTVQERSVWKDSVRPYSTVSPYVYGLTVQWL